MNEHAVEVIGGQSNWGTDEMRRLAQLEQR
jgi:hypothetical protein